MVGWERSFFAKFKQPRVSRDEAVMVVCACVRVCGVGPVAGGWVREWLVCRKKEIRGLFASAAGESSPCVTRHR